MNKGAWHDMTAKLFGKVGRAMDKAFNRGAKKTTNQGSKSSTNNSYSNQRKNKYEDKKAKFNAKANKKFEKIKHKAEIKNKKAELKQAKIQLKNNTSNLEKVGENNPVFEKMSQDHFGMSWTEFAKKHGANTMKIANKFKGLINKAQGKDIDSAMRKYNKNPTASNLVKLEDAIFKATSHTDREALKEYKMNMAKFIPIGLAVAVAMTAMPQGQ